MIGSTGQGMPDGVTSSGQKKNRQTNLEWSPVGSEVDRNRDAHGKSDVDSGPDALHHTLGRKPFQAAPGGLTEMTAIVGQTFMWFASEPPKGFLILAGQEISRSDYPELWTFANENGLVGSQATGSPFGEGNGSTTFRVPDMVYRVPIGVSTNPGTNEGIDRAIHTFPTNIAVRWRSFYLRHRHFYQRPLQELTSTTTGAHTHSTTDAGNHSHTTSDFAHNQSENTETVSPGAQRLTGPMFHNHGTDFNGTHSHTAQSAGDHAHVVTIPEELDKLTDYSTEYRAIVTSNDGAVAGLFTGNVPSFAHIEVCWVMRYTSLFDFEGAVLPPDGT